MDIMNNSVQPSKAEQSPDASTTDALREARDKAIAALSPETRKEIGEAELQTMPLAILRGLPEAERYVAALNKANSQ